MIDAARVQLVLVSNPHVNSESDFEALAELVRCIDSAVQVRVVRDVSTEQGLEYVLPTLGVSFAPVLHLKLDRGRLLQGRLMPKSEEYRRLAARSIPVPRWERVTYGQSVDVTSFGTHAVTKPDFGARGADVRVQRTAGLTWQAPKTQMALRLGGRRNPMLVQEFIYTGPWPVSFRVVTLWGDVLWALRVEASHERRPLPGPGAFSHGGYSIVSSGRGCTFAYCDDPDVLALGSAAHAAFPEIPLLGVDIVRDANLGTLYVVEANSFGFTWHMSSERGLAMQRQFGLDLDAQFDGKRRAAERLARACRELAV